MTSRTKDEQALERLWKAHFDELRDMSDEDIMKDVDVPKFRTDRIQLMSSARTEAGQRRLAKAKAHVATVKPATNLQVNISVAEAREFVRKAANDPRVTLAARGLDEMTDEMILRTYARLQGLWPQTPERDG